MHLHGLEVLVVSVMTMLGLDDFVVVDFVVESGAICVPEVAE